MSEDVIDARTDEVRTLAGVDAGLGDRVRLHAHIKAQLALGEQESAELAADDVVSRVRSLRAKDEERAAYETETEQAERTRSLSSSIEPANLRGLVAPYDRDEASPISPCAAQLQAWVIGTDHTRATTG